jgi:hypothetical protein
LLRYLRDLDVILKGFFFTYFYMFRYFVARNNSAVGTMNSIVWADKSVLDKLDNESI